MIMHMIDGKWESANKGKNAAKGILQVLRMSDWCAHLHRVMLGYIWGDVCVEVCGSRLVFQGQIQRDKRSWQFENLGSYFVATRYKNISIIIRWK